MPDLASAPPVPERLGPFVLVERLGAGAMGTVWRARDEEEERDVALKVFPPDLSRRDGFLARFQRETEAGKRIEDPHVVRTYGAEMQLIDGEPCCLLVLEYVEGQSLRELLANLGVVPEGLVREIARQIALGLVAIHAAGVVHRDLKPENVLLTPANVVRIADLGVSKVLDATVALTREGHFAGSLVYASPEQIHGRDVAPASDLYSLGVLVHELLTGANPFARGSAAEVMQAHLTGEVPDVQYVAQDTSDFLAEVVRTLLERTPQRRFDSAAALAAVLGEGESSSWWRARADDAARRRAHLPRVPVRRETALHGREDDLALLRASWDRTRTGEGHTVLVIGEAGIGKSRLVDAFFGTLAGAECSVLYGSFPPVGGRGAITDAIVAHLGAEGLDGKLASLLSAAPGVAPSLAAWLRHEPSPQGAAPLDGDAIQSALVGLMRGLAAAKPLVWVVEDLHFADGDSRKLALSLASAAGGHRVLLLLTSRPGLPEAEVRQLERGGNLRRTDLARLSAREVVLLLQDAFRSERLAEKLGAKVALASDGNPFFVFEMIRGLKQGQFVTELPDGTWVDTKAIEQIPVPPAVRDLVAARLTDLPQGHREIVDAGAVQGYEFDADLVADVLGRNRFEVLRDLAQVERSSGVVRSTGRRHRFDHHQIQEFLYSDLSQPLREEFHAATADAIERACGAGEKDPATIDGEVAVALAAHFLRSRCGKQGLRYLDAAMTHLDVRFQNEPSADLAALALARPGLVEGLRRAELLWRRAYRLALLGRVGEEGSCLREALALVGAPSDGRLRVRALGRLGQHCLRTNQDDEAMRYLCEALDLERASSVVRNEPVALNDIARLHRRGARFSAARSCYERARALAAEVGNAEIVLAVAMNLPTLDLAVGRWADARGALLEVLESVESAGDVRATAMVRRNLSMALTHLGRHDEALAELTTALDLIRRFGDRPNEALILAGFDEPLEALNRFDEARARCHEAAQLAREIGDAELEIFCTLRLARLCPDERGRLTASALAQLERIGGRLPAHEEMELRFLLWEVTGDPVHLAESSRLLRETAARLDPDDRESLLSHRRDIVAAAAEAGL